jgi:hypothetical protein
MRSRPCNVRAGGPESECLVPVQRSFFLPAPNDTLVKSTQILFLALLVPLLASCSTYPGSMHAALFAYNRYLLPVRGHGAAVVVAAPPGWRLDLKGGPCSTDAFIRPEDPASQIVISTYDDPHAAHTTSQAQLYARMLAEERREEPERLAICRKMARGFAPAHRPAVPSRDPVSHQHLATVELRDGRRIWITRFHSPVIGSDLRAFIPEAGFVTAYYFESFGGSAMPAELLNAAMVTVTSYRCEWK